MKNLDITFDYNEDADILHISLGTGEPSYCEEVDDFLLVERGYFSHQITGFQIMDVSYHGIQQVEVGAFIKRALAEEAKEVRDLIQEKKNRVPDLIMNKLSRNRRLGRLLEHHEA